MIPLYDVDILIVDDDLEIRTALTYLLETIGKISSYPTPKLGLEAFQKKNFAVVVADQSMPEMSGEAFLRKIRKIDPRTYRILISGLRKEHVIKRILDSGTAHCCFSKPWENLEVRSYVIMAIEGYLSRNGNQ
jgi:response regulator RpfG family c-di-GMP phosphodiesterase